MTDYGTTNIEIANCSSLHSRLPYPATEATNYSKTTVPQSSDRLDISRTPPRIPVKNGANRSLPAMSPEFKELLSLFLSHSLPSFSLSLFLSLSGRKEIKSSPFPSRDPNPLHEFEMFSSLFRL